MRYDTTIATETRTKRVDTCHIEQIDWEYDFFNPAHSSGHYGTAEQKRDYIEKQILRLKRVEEALSAGEEVWASDYGGWPRIWQKAIGVAMVSKWPYWSPRPNILVTAWHGPEWFDWHRITNVSVGEEVI